MCQEPFAPDPPLDPLTITHVRGPGILAFRATILAGLTTERQQLLLAELGSEALDLMRQSPGAEAWVPVERLSEIRAAYSKLFETRLEKVRGFTMASLLFSHPMFQELRDTRTISQFLTRLPQIWETTHKGGRIEAAHLGPKQARITIQAQFPDPQYLEQILPLALQEALNLLGLRQGRVDHHTPDNRPGTHIFDLHWEL